jgi:hypothetical protein
MRPDRRPVVTLLQALDDETFARFVIWAAALYVPIAAFPSPAADLREAAQAFLEAVRRGGR